MSNRTPLSVEYDRILVLYASQTGNSEQAAKELCAQLHEKLSTASFQVTARHMQLDDFLELKRGRWTRVVVLVLSSYGVGQAPLGGYRFREFCDALLESSDMMLNGLQFAMLGLGDSKFTTFFQNPTVTEKALVYAGARRIGPLGKADASGTGDQAQLTVIDRWVDGIWPHLKTALKESPLSKRDLETMQRKTFDLCLKLNPDLVEMVNEEKKRASRAKYYYLAAYLCCVLMLAGVYVFVIWPEQERKNRRGDGSLDEL